MSSIIKIYSSIILKHGLIATKIHRIVSFVQRRWLKPWIDV